MFRPAISTVRCISRNRLAVSTNPSSPACSSTSSADAVVSSLTSGSRLDLATFSVSRSSGAMASSAGSRSSRPAPAARTRSS